MYTVGNITIEKIEQLTEETAKEIAEDSMEIKGHNIYFIDFGGHFGYSVVVFCNGHHIHYANDYELNHRWQNASHEELKQIYIKGLNRKLFTEEELSEPIKNYTDFECKRHFLQNYYGMRQDYISVFRIAPTEKEEKEFRRRVEKMFFNPVCYAYYDDKEFVQHRIDLSIALAKAEEETLNNFEYWKNAIYLEMCNHEYGINLQADFDTLSAFGNPEWHGESNEALEKMFDEVEFNDMQRKAYIEARKEYYKKAEEGGWF
jgi:hypothetical protein